MQKAEIDQQPICSACGNEIHESCDNCDQDLEQEEDYIYCDMGKGHYCHICGSSTKPKKELNTQKNRKKS